MRPPIHCVIPLPASRARLPHLVASHTPLRLSSANLYQRNLLSTPTRIRPLTTTPTMASDDAYMSFLDKANTDVSGDKPQTSAQTTTVTSSLPVPKPLQSLNLYYTSDTDEPFEPIALNWDGAKWPTADQFSSLISPDTDLSSSIESLDPGSFDPQNQYAAALDAVRDASGDKSAELKIFRVEITSTKIEYWILAFAKPEGRLVGLRAKAVES
ncbi:unnamed protein product [Penicillium olsonii]|nr:unnamed protein product [Penicillium olsonii]